MSKKLIVGVSAVALTGVVVGIRHKNKRELSNHYVNRLCDEIERLVDDFMDDAITIGKFQNQLSKIACYDTYRNLPKKYKSQVDRVFDYAESLVADSWEVSGDAFYSSL